MKRKNIEKIIVLVVIIALLIFLAFIQINHQTNKYDNLEINSSELNIFFFNVGQAESILITNNNAKMLIDCGNNSDGKYISKFLKEQGMDKLDYLIGTHIDIVKPTYAIISAGNNENYNHPDQSVIFFGRFVKKF